MSNQHPPRGIRGLTSAVACLATISMAAASCGQPAAVERDAASAMESPAQLAALLSLPPTPGLEEGGGGIIGGVFTVYGMPGATGPTDPGLPPEILQQSTAGGVRVAFTAQANEGPYQFQLYDMSDPNAFTKAPLWDTGAVNTSGPLPAEAVPSDHDGYGSGLQTPAAHQAQRKGLTKKIRYGNQFLRDARTVSAAAADKGRCTIASTEVSCTIGSSYLRVGGSYAIVTTSNPDGVQNTDKRVFSVRDLEAVSGSTTAEFPAASIDTPYGSYGIGLTYSTAAIGVTKDQASVGGFSNGLPPGWSWKGVGGGIDSISRASAGAAGYQGYDQTLTLHRGPISTLLGCTTGKAGSYCRPMAGAAPGQSYSAFIPLGSPPNAPVSITDQSSGQIATFDGNGRLSATEEPGTYPLAITYRNSGGAGVFDTVSYQDLQWRFHYKGDGECDDTSVPAGFSATPDGFVCAVELPTRDWLRLSYTLPAGDTHAPRLSRVTRVSPDCSWNLADCPRGDMEMTDYGWDASNRPYLNRAPTTAWAVANGALSPGYDPSTQPAQQLQEADPTLQKMVFDDLGRISSTISPVPSDGAPRLVTNRQYAEYGSVPATFAGSARAVTMTTEASDASVSAMALTRSYDDAGRGLYTLDPNGELDKLVWHPLVLSGPMGSISPAHVAGSKFDIRGRHTNSYEGPPSAFDLSVCTPDVAPANAKRDACVPKPGAQTVSQSYTYDQVSAGKPESGDVGSGLTQQWFKSADFSQPVGSPSVVGWEGGSPPGFALQPPPGIGNQYAVVFEGGVRLKPGTWQVTASVPDPRIDGIVQIDNQTCQFAGQLAGGCTLSNDRGAKMFTTDPVQIVIALTRDDTSTTPAFGKVHLRFTNTESGQDLALNDSVFTRRYGEVTAETSTDPLMGSQNSYSSTTYLTFGDPAVGAATMVAGTGDSPDYPGTASGGATSTEYRVDALGAVQVAKQTSPTGAAVLTAIYYGDGDTARDAGFTNMEEVSTDSPDLLGVNQRGQLKTVISQNGRRKNFIYDRYGKSVCTQLSTSDADPDAHWSCKMRDSMYQMTAATFRDHGDGGLIVNKYSYRVGTAGTGPAVTAVINTEQSSPGGAVDSQTQTSESDAAGRLLKYVDAVGTVTTYGYDAHNQIATASVTAAPNGPTQYQPAKFDYRYNSAGQLSSLAIDNAMMAQVSYLDASSPFVGSIDSVTYPTFANISLKMTYQLNDPTAVIRTFQLANRTVTDSMTSTMSGRAVAASFAGANMSFKYDDTMRLQWAELDGTDFTYGYDIDGQRTCAAYAINNPGGKSACSALPGSFGYHYTNGMVDAQSTNPKVNIPGDMSQAFTPTGELRQFLDTTTNSTNAYTYDQRQQLRSQKVTNPDPFAPAGTTTFRRDAQGRIIARDSQLTNGVTPSPSPTATTATTTTTPTATTATPTPTPTPSPSPTATTATPTPTPTPSMTVGTATINARFGYSSPAEDSQIITYSAAGPLFSMSLPGGVTFSGGEGSISALAGFATFIFDTSTGTAPSFPPQFTGPFREVENADPNKVSYESVIPAAATEEYGVRSFLPELGLFLQADPSFTPGQPTYGLANGDPVSYTDPTGLSSAPRFPSSDSHRLPWWAQTIISLFTSAFSTFLAGAIADFVLFRRAWYKAASTLVQRFLAFTLYSFVNVGTSMASAAAMSGGDLKKVYGITWTIDGMMAMVSGYIGAYTASIGSKMGTLMEQASALMTQVSETLRSVRAEVTAVSRGLMHEAEIFAKELWATNTEYLAEIKEGLTAFGKEVSNSILQAGTELLKKEGVPMLKEVGKQAIKDKMKATGVNLFNKLGFFKGAKNILNAEEKFAASNDIAEKEKFKVWAGNYDPNNPLSNPAVLYEKYMGLTAQGKEAFEQEHVWNNKYYPRINKK